MDEHKQHRVASGARTAWFVVVSFVLGGSARAQIPPIPVPAQPAAKTDSQAKPVVAPTKNNPETTVATSSGPINVDKPVDDSGVQENLIALLPQLPGVRSVTVSVRNGVVRIAGHVEDEDTRDRVTDFTRRVVGVRLIVNAMKTDAQVLNAPHLALKVLTGIWSDVSRKWLVVLVALAFFVVFTMLAQLFNRYSETVLAPFISNPLLRSVAGSFLGGLLLLAGILVALSILNLTHVVLSIVGLASLVGLAIGFAFRDITENFIASILLGVRRPFRVGDYIQVAGQAGVVKTLNTRATVLVTLDGNHVRIPNATVFKEILINSSASATSRGTFDVVIPYSVSVADALEAMNKALREQEEILPDPPPRALVEALEQGGVRLRAYYWMPSQGVDGFKLNSDAKLKVKVALQQAGIAPPPLTATIAVIGKVPVDVSEVARHICDDATIRPGAVVSTEEAAANLRRDRRAAATATVSPADGHETPMEHVLSEAENHVSDEGANLLATPAPAGSPNGTG